MDAPTTPFQRMQYFLREIGQGPKHCRDLTREEACEALGMILDQTVTRAQMGGFLLIERFKGESAEELLGFADAIRARARTISPRLQGLLDVGSPYDGRRRSLVASPAASLVAAAAGQPIVMHGEKDMPPKHGIGVIDVLEAMGVDVAAEPAETEACIQDTGFGFMRQSRFVPPLFALKDLREEIALRSAISTMEKLCNLAGASYSLVGLTHLPYVEKMLEAAQRMGFRRLMIVQGLEGNEDAPTSRPCRVFEWAEGQMQERRLNPADYDLQPASPEDLAGGDARYNAEALRQVLRGEDKGPRLDLVAFNAGLRLYLGGQAASIGQGLAMAREAIASGAAWQKLLGLQARAAARTR